MNIKTVLPLSTYLFTSQFASAWFFLAAVMFLPSSFT